MEGREIYLKLRHKEDAECPLVKKQPGLGYRRYTQKSEDGMEYSDRQTLVSGKGEVAKRKESAGIWDKKGREKRAGKNGERIGEEEPPLLKNRYGKWEA